MPKLAVMNGIYIPKDVEFIDDKGKLKSNFEFPKSERVKVELTYASLGQKNAYMQSYAEAAKGKENSTKIKTDISYDKALKKHVMKIENLEDEKGNVIKNGYQLADCQHPGLNELKQDLFYRICGIRLDDEVDDGPGELTVGEEKASV